MNLKEGVQVSSRERSRNYTYKTFQEVSMDDLLGLPVPEINLI